MLVLNNVLFKWLKFKKIQWNHLDSSESNTLYTCSFIFAFSNRINKKIPRGPPSPPAPILHSPTRKVTVKEQQDWKIPPCISNWKNAKV
jgi:hypothetical protein